MMSPRHTSSAFTLVELLVSMAVLILLVLTVVGMVNGVSRSTTSGRRHLEADDEARRVFDRMAYDFARMFKRADADSIFAPIKGTDAAHGANDKMFFYSEAPTYFDPASQSVPPAVDPRSTAGLVGYRIPNGAATDRWQLERLGKGLTWDGQTGGSLPGAVVFLTYPPALPSPAPSPTPLPASTVAVNWATTIGTPPNNYDDGVDPDFHVLSSYVFRVEYAFVLKNPTSAKQFAVTHDQTKGFQDVTAIVVAIAILDPQARALLPSTTAGLPPDLSKLAAALPDPDFITNPPGKLMAQLWNSRIRDSAFAADAGIPKAVASQIYVYQRYFYLNNPK